MVVVVRLWFEFERDVSMRGGGQRRASSGWRRFEGPGNCGPPHEIIKVLGKMWYNLTMVWICVCVKHGICYLGIGTGTGLFYREWGEGREL